MKCKVVHVNSPEFRDNPDAVYIGRRNYRAKDKRCHKWSQWSNPFTARCATGPRRCDPMLVHISIASFEDWLRHRITNGDGCVQLIEDLLSLDGKVLGCWCHPKPCHGNVLVKLIAELKSEPGTRGGG